MSDTEDKHKKLIEIAERLAFMSGLNAMKEKIANELREQENLTQKIVKDTAEAFHDMSNAMTVLDKSDLKQNN